MAFDYEKAKRDGFTDDEIAQHLSKKSGFKFDQAIQDGFSPKQIVDTLIKRDLTPSSSGQTDFGGVDRPDIKEKPGQAERMRSMNKNLPAAIGATALTLAAPGVGLPAAAGLAALGGAGGEGFRQVAERMTDNPVDVAETPMEAVKDVAAAGAKQAGYELGGRLAIKAIAKIAAPFASKVTEVGRAVNKKLKEVGSSLIPSQMTDSRTLDLVENMARGSFFGSGTMLAKEAEQNLALKEIGEGVSKKFSKEVTKLQDREVGELFVDTVTEGRAAFKSAAEKLYRNVDDLVDEAVTKSGKLKSVSTGQFKKAVVATTALKNRANELAAEFSRIKDIGKSDAGGKLIESVKGLDDMIGFGDAQMLRSNLLNVARDLKSFGADSKAHAIATEMAVLANSAMEEAGKSLPTGALKAWQQANKFYKFGTKYFDNDFIANLALSGKVPWERVGEKVFASGNVEQVLKTRRALRVAESMQKKGGEVAFKFDDAWKAMQSGFYENQVLAPSIKDGVIDGATLAKRIENPKLARTMKAAFTGEQLNAIKDFANTAKLVQKKPEGGAGMVMQIAQGGAVINLVGAPFALASGAEIGPTLAGAMGGSSGGIFIAPHVMAKLLTSPKTAKWLTEGFKLPVGSEAGTVLGARILKAANDVMSFKKREAFEERRKAKGLPVKGKK